MINLTTFTISNDDDYILELSDEDAKATAERLDCNVEFADSMTLQLDIDTAWDGRNKASAILDFLSEVYPPLAGSYIEWSTSRNGNYHGTIALSSPLDTETRIMLQALMGSDPWREAYCIKRHKLGADNPIRLFRPKAEVKPKEGWDDLPF